MPTRRDLLVGAPALGVAVLGAASLANSAIAFAADTKPADTKTSEAKAAAAPTGPFTLAALPFADTDLVPYISQNTLSFHYGKHHAKYVSKLNELYVGNEAMGTTPEAVAKAAYGDKDHTPLYNNAAQAWNHTFLWNSMKKNGGGMPTTGKLADALKAAFTDADGFKKAFRDTATSQFGSGWAWLVLNKGKLEICSTANQDSPVSEGKTPLLTLDVWEHSYYLKYQNKRAEYIENWWKVVDWQAVNKRFLDA